MFTTFCRASVAAVGILFLTFGGTRIGCAQVSVTTWHYDNTLSGANPNEMILTPQNVNSKQFGKLFSQLVDGLVVGQALYLPGVTIPGAGVHNVIYVVTMHDSVYAFDADDSLGSNSNPLWHTSFLSSGVTTVPIAKQGCEPTTKWTEVGILSTPVIDSATGSIYVVAKTYENSMFVNRLHSLDVTTGLENPGSPIVIEASYFYAGTNNVFASMTQLPFAIPVVGKSSEYSHHRRGEKAKRGISPLFDRPNWH